MERDSGKDETICGDRVCEDSICEDRENIVRDKTLKDRTSSEKRFHRNVCWQRSYQRPEGKELIIALYGSLRDGLYNSRRFNLQNRSELLGMTKIEGYALYSMGPYPGVYPLEDSYVIAEVRRFSGKEQLDVAKSIDYMELFGGYHREYVDLGIGEQKFRGFIYVYDEKPESERIEHGDWARYLKEKELQEGDLPD
ncbi:MAG: gamma-glutamylcyclotransferase family protein [Methanosarcina sp.]|jgi:gamma-glutamylcyclotransferase (GGCT)/AIG2-like uncharacterized protein YtfP